MQIKAGKILIGRCGIFGNILRKGVYFPADAPYNNRMEHVDFDTIEGESETMDHQNILETVKAIHFIGIGGSGMSPIAEILHHRGFRVTGSDINESDTLERVRSWGVPVRMEQKAENIAETGAELVVYSAAVKPDNPELAEAQRRGIPTLERSVLLGILTRQYPQMVAVAGTHGKTTTTSMVTQIMMVGGKDPSAIIGGKLPILGSNARVGNSDLMICEACEYVDTFLQLTPTVSTLLNIDADHLDYFGSLENIIHSFHRFAAQTTQTLIVNGEDENVQKAISGIKNRTVVSFGLGDQNDYWAADIRRETDAYEAFTLMHKNERIAEIKLSVPGRHNVWNALAAAATVHHCGVAPEAIAEGLHAFTGAHRRFEFLGTFDGVTVVDDFAHHPTELETTLTAAMNMGYREVWAIFQPHTFSRTYLLLDDFAKVLRIPDHVIMTEILAVRETNKYGVHVQDLADKIPGSCWFSWFEEICEYGGKMAQPGDWILTLGGGNIYKCANQIVAQYQQK